MKSNNITFTCSCKFHFSLLIGFSSNGRWPTSLPDSPLPWDHGYYGTVVFLIMQKTRLTVHSLLLHLFSTVMKISVQLWDCTFEYFLRSRWSSLVVLSPPLPPRWSLDHVCRPVGTFRVAWWRIFRRWIWKGFCIYDLPWNLCNIMSRHLSGG